MPQRDDAGSGQGRQIDDQFWFVAFCISQGVGEDQTAFCVSVKDFNCLTGEAGEDVSRPEGGCLGHIFNSRNYAHQVDR